MSGTPDYRLKLKTGDIVLMPCGKVGIITHWDIIEGGHVKEVVVYPFTNWIHKLWLMLTMRTRLYNEEIDSLKLITPAANRF